MNKSSDPPLKTSVAARNNYDDGICQARKSQTRSGNVESKSSMRPRWVQDAGAEQTMSRAEEATAGPPTHLATKGGLLQCGGGMDPIEEAARPPATGLPYHVFEGWCVHSGEAILVGVGANAHTPI
jgi:hypothetical protein